MASNTTEPGRMWMPRRRGAAGGLLLMLLGAWGAIVPFVGPYFDFTYGPDSVWTWTAARGWFEVAPGAAVFLGGLMLLLTSSRGTALTGAWLAVAGGAWFVIGPVLEPWLAPGELGGPGDTRAGMAALEQIAYYSGLGAVILLIGGTTLGRVSALTVGDARVAQARRDRAMTTTGPSTEPTASNRATGDRAAGEPESTSRRHHGLFPHPRAHVAGQGAGR